MDLLQSLETNDKKYKHSDFLQSSSLMKTKARLVEEYGEQFVKLTHGNICAGVVLVIKAFGLSEVAKTRAVKIHLSIDGAQLSKRMSHLCM